MENIAFLISLFKQLSDKRQSTEMEIMQYMKDAQLLLVVIAFALCWLYLDDIHEPQYCDAEGTK